MSRIFLNKQYVLSPPPSLLCSNLTHSCRHFITVQLLRLLHITTLGAIYVHRQSTLFVAPLCIAKLCNSASTISMWRRGGQSTTRSKITIWPVQGERSSETTANDNPIIAPQPLQHAFHTWHTIPNQQNHTTPLITYHTKPTIPYHTWYTIQAGICIISQTGIMVGLSFLLLSPTW